MSEEFVNVFFKQPAFALVVGISNYESGVDVPDEGDRLLDDHQFPNLKLADKDATDFATFLRTNGFIGENVRSLINKQASKPKIIEEFEELRKRCRSSGDEGPLVIVYFSGHGWPDEDDEEVFYLVPWDAKRNKLRTSAISNQSFGELLGGLKTNRLAVFLDACHAGAMGMKYARGPAQVLYDSHRALGEGEGRYLIASCKPGQKSFEHGENGIFTGHLLQLLKCETDDIPKPEIDILSLYQALQPKVAKTAWEEHEQVQEPVLDARGDGLILAINQRAKRKKLELDKETLAQRLKFLEKICTLIKASKSQQKITISRTLRIYVEKGSRFKGYDEFYSLFDEHLALWKEHQRTRLEECCDLLLETYRAAIDSPAVSKEDQSQQPSKPDDKFVSAAENKVMGAEETTAPATPISPQSPQQPRRQLSDDDLNYLLEGGISTNSDYYRARRKLSFVLSRPISKTEFSEAINNVSDSRKGDDAFTELIDKMIERFNDRWPKSKEVESKTVSSLMLGR
jgi:hypothetical protein